jgi:hypothetical protein
MSAMISKGMGEKLAFTIGPASLGEGLAGISSPRKIIIICLVK